MKTKFEQWYSQQKDLILNMKTREEVAFYVWTNKPKSTPKRTETPCTGFEEFWAAYPLKIARQAALNTWNKAKPPIIDIMEALSWQTKQENWVKENGKFIPHPTTYLNQQRWLDEKPVGFKETKVVEMETYTDMNGCKRERPKA